MQLKATQQAFRVALIYVIVSVVWILISDELVKRIISDPDTRIYVSIIKGWGFVSLTGVFLFRVLRRLLAKRDLEAKERQQAETAQQESQRKLEAALASMTDAVFISDADGHFIEFNEAFATFHRFKNKAECVRELSDYLKILDIITADGELLPLDRWAVPRALRGESAANVEYTLRRKDTGETWTGSYSFNPIRDQDGVIVGSVVVARDISEGKLARQKLQASEERYMALFERSLDCVFLVDFEGQFLDANQGALDLLGYRREEISSVTFETLLSKDQIPQALQSVAEIRATGSQKLPLEFKLRSKDGREVFVETQSSLLYQNGKPYAIQGIARNIGAWKLAAQKLRDSEEQYRQLFELESDAITLVDCETHRYVDVNLSAQRLYGYSREELLQMRPEEVSDDPEKTRATVGTGSIHVPLCWHRKKNGERFAVEITANLIEYRGRRTELATVRDITARQQAMDMLAETAAQLLEAQRIAGIGSYALDVRTGIWTSSEVLNELFGLADDGVTKDVARWLEIIHPQDRAEMRRYLDEEVLKQHKPFDRNYRIVRLNDRQERWVHGLGKLVLDDHGQIVSMMGVIQDITERKLAEEALRESQALYHSLVAQLPIGLFRKDQQGRYVLVNAGFCQLKGMKAEQFLGKTPQEVASDEAAQQDAAGLATKFAALGEEHHQQIMRTGQPIELDEEYSLADGRKLFVHAMKLPVLNPDGTVIGTQGVVFNITERKLSEERMNLQFSALTAAANAIVITDHNGKIEWVNPAFTRLTGYSVAEAIGSFPRLLKSGEHPPEFYADMWTTIKAGEVWHGELVNKHKDGRHYKEDMTITPVRGADGQIAHFVAIKQDVTERRTLENQLRQAQKMEAIGTLAGGIAHDFNNILAAMFGYGYLLQEDLADNPAAQEGIAEILKAASRAKDLVQQILTFSRQREHKRQIIPLDTIVKEAMKFLRASLPANIKIEMQLDAAAPAILADPTQIYQITINLATNALHAMEGRSGQLAVRLEAFLPDETFILAHPEFRPIQYTRLTVADTGQGMDAKTLERIFEPFFTTKPVGKGTGLGLSVVHGIVKSHDGVITVQSEVGRGTTFQLYFPARTSDVTFTEIAPDNIPRGQGQRILLVDDEAPLVAMFQRLLVRLNYQVTSCRSAREAMAFFQSDPAQFDLVITDLTMQETNGLELARQIRAVRPELPVILSSGFTANLDREDLRQAGICGLIEKPASMTALAEVTQRALAKPPAPG